MGAQRGQEDGLGARWLSHPRFQQRLLACAGDDAQSVQWPRAAAQRGSPSLGNRSPEILNKQQEEQAFPRSF
jgi:hypothetical protein